MSASEWRIEITIFEKHNGPFTKRISLVDGKPLSDSSACHMAKGTARRIRIDGVQPLADLINNFTSNQAYALGRIKDGHPDHVRVVTARKLSGEDPSVIARTKDFLVFKDGEPGLVLLDFDPKAMSEAAARHMEECGGLWGALLEVMPAFESVAFVQRASTSSNLRNVDTGETFPGSGGQHIVIPVLDAADIPRFLSDLHDRLWLAGFGWGMVAGDGKFLPRSLVDKSVGSSERPVFEGPPIIEPPLVQEGRHAVAHDGYVLDTRSCPPLADDEKAEVQRLQDAEERRLSPERLAARANWSAGHIERLIASGMSETEARTQVHRWIDGQELSGAFPLPFDEPSIAGTTVEAVLAAPDNYVGKTLSDPVEGPSYGRGKAILYRRPNGSLFIHSFAHGSICYELKTKAASEREAEIERLARLSRQEYEQERKAAAKMLSMRVTALDEFVDKARAELGRKRRATPEAQEAERQRIAAEAEAAHLARDAERERLWQGCRDLALAPDLMNLTVNMARRLGVVGERAAICGSYLAMTSRLLKDSAISLLRRGAPAGGKNYLLSSVSRLIPRESTISISSASPMALIYHGDDVNSLRHKVIIVPEAAAIAQKSNGDENPTTIMLRTLLSEGRIDREVAITQRNGVPKTVHVQRNGPVCLMLTSARENVDQEMLTRLMTSDADESRDQTLAVVKRTLLGSPTPVTEEEVEVWLDLQRWLALDVPYGVVVPFAAAIYEAYKELIASLPSALQVRMRRDISGLIAGVKASAVLHRAQRSTDETGRIVADLADYRHAWNSFNQSVASLYGVKPRAEIIAVVEAAAKLGAQIKNVGGQSVKITLAALCNELGINSKDIAANRLREAVEIGALEEDDSKRGSGRGRPRFYWLLKTGDELRAAPARSVFPAPHSVKQMFEVGEGSRTNGQDGLNGQDAQIIDFTSSSCPASCPSSVRPDGQDGQEAGLAGLSGSSCPSRPSGKKAGVEKSGKDSAMISMGYSSCPSCPPVSDPSLSGKSFSTPQEDVREAAQPGPVPPPERISESPAPSGVAKADTPKLGPSAPPPPGPPASWRGLMPRAVDHLAREFSELKAGSAAELQDAIRTRLAACGVPVEAHDVEVEKVVRRIEALGGGSGTTVNSPAHVGGAAKPVLYETLGWGPPGSRCDSCGKGIGIKRVKFSDRVALLHRACADRYFADPPVQAHG